MRSHTNMGKIKITRDLWRYKKKATELPSTIIYEVTDIDNEFNLPPFYAQFLDLRAGFAYELTILLKRPDKDVEHSVAGQIRQFLEQVVPPQAHRHRHYYSDNTLSRDAFR